MSALAAEPRPTVVPLRVFLLDDTPELRRRVRRHLVGAGGVVVVGEADDPVDGLPRIAGLQPDAVLLDLSMPRMDGLEAIGHIAEGAPDAAVVVFSGFLGEAMGDTALALGADAYVEKNRPLAEVSEILRDAVAARRRGERPVPRPAAQRPDVAAAGQPPAVAAPAPARRSELPGPRLAVGLVVAQLAAIALATAGVIPTALHVVALAQGAALVAGAIWFTARVRSDMAAQEALNRELERSNTELEQVAYAASHDLAEPLRTIKACAQLVDRRAGDGLDDVSRRSLEHLTSASDRMQRMVEDMLACSRLGRAELRTSRFSLAEVLDDVVGDLAHQVAERDAQVVAGALPELSGDEARIAQVLRNLVGNAVKFCPADRRPRVEVTAAPVPTGWRIDVRDNGVGVDPRDGERVFRMFERLHGQDEYPGTGIGLAICRRIVERHGGRIWVDGDPGRGSCFSFTVPGEPAAA